jgi:hypothetical protein
VWSSVLVKSVTPRSLEVFVIRPRDLSRRNSEANTEFRLLNQVPPSLADVNQMLIFIPRQESVHDKTKLANSLLSECLTPLYFPEGKVDTSGQLEGL